MLKNNHTVKIRDKDYRFCRQLNGEPALLKSFNQLSKETFDLAFERVGGMYEPHVLADGNTVCANVSVNQVPFWDGGKRGFYIQLGTVMTREDCRGQGLSHWLIEEIMHEWQDRCDAIYLFANDSVLDFYPRFGFEPQAEFEFVYEKPGRKAFLGKKLSMENPFDACLALKKISGKKSVFRLLHD